jgi:predicted MFS family arabinose efflux permease
VADGNGVPNDRTVAPVGICASSPRRVVVLVSVIVLIDVCFFSAVAPLLPSYVVELGLSKSQAGVLVGAYAAGTLLASLPAGRLTARRGAPRVLVSGLLLLAMASVAFGVGSSFAVLAGARLLQGVGGAASWAAGLTWLVQEAPRERRGQMIGTVLGAGVAGAIGGPVLGALAHASSPRLVFGVVGVVALGLAAAVVLTPSRKHTPQTGTLRQALRQPAVRVGAWLTVLPAMYFGVAGVLVPLRLDELGLGATGVAVVFLCAAAVEAAGSPLVGRLSDRFGRLLPLRAGLGGVLAGCLLLPLPGRAVLLAVVVVFAAAMSRMLMTPASALLSDGAEASGLPQGLAFGLFNLAWAAGQGIGSAGGSRFAESVGDTASYLAVAVLSAATLAVLIVRAPTGVR